MMTEYPSLIDPQENRFGAARQGDFARTAGVGVMRGYSGVKSISGDSERTGFRAPPCFIGLLV